MKNQVGRGRRHREEPGAGGATKTRGKHGRHMLAAATMLAMPAQAAPPHGVAVANAEDLAQTADGRWIIASSMAGGSRTAGMLILVDTLSGDTRALGVENARPDALARGCGGPVPADRIAPHGISLGKGGKRLYVVNHGTRESIEIFDVAMKPVPTLRWSGCLVLPAGAFANAVAPGRGDTLFATNNGKALDGSKPLSFLGGEVIRWDPGQGWRSVPGSAMVAPNGIVATPDGSRLYVASWLGSALIELTPGARATKRRTVKLDFHPDNLRWDGRNRLFVTGQSGTLDAIKACYVSRRDSCGVPSRMAEVNLRTFEPCARDVPVGMATVAVRVRKEIWIGTVRGAAIVRLGEGERICGRQPKAGRRAAREDG